MPKNTYINEFGEIIKLSMETYYWSIDKFSLKHYSIAISPYTIEDNDTLNEVCRSNRVDKYEESELVLSMDTLFLSIEKYFRNV